jgi:hypothetical protein
VPPVTTITGVSGPGDGVEHVGAPVAALRELARRTAQDLLDVDLVDAPDSGVITRVITSFLAQLTSVTEALARDTDPLVRAAVATVEQARTRLTTQPVTPEEIQVAISELLVCSSTVTSTPAPSSGAEKICDP